MIEAGVIEEKNLNLYKKVKLAEKCGDQHVLQEEKEPLTTEEINIQLAIHKGTVFFFPRKSLGGTHSLVLGLFCFFFPGYPEKKNNPKFGPNVFFFFLLQEKFTRQSLTRFERPEKKNSPGKKNSIFTHSLEKPQKCANFKLFRGKKNTVPLTQRF